MSEIHGFSQQNVGGLRGSVSQSVGRLGELGVDGPSQRHRDPSPRYLEQFRSRQVGGGGGSMNVIFEETLGRTEQSNEPTKLPSKKSQDVRAKIGWEALSSGFHDKLQARFEISSRKELREMKSLMHYSAFSLSTLNPNRLRVTPEDRITTRAAVLSAFAQGASLEDIARLREVLDGWPPNQGSGRGSSYSRDHVLHQLNMPGADPHKIISGLREW